MAPALPSFGQENFGAVDLGHRRRNRRLVRIADRMVQRPQGTLPDKVQSPAELKALYRLMNHPSTTHAAVLAPHVAVTRQRMAACGTVLTIQDATELDYTGKKSLRDLGQLGKGSQRGYLCHNVLAFDPRRREVIGLAHQILHCREDAPENETREAQRSRESRESRLWQRASQALGTPPEGCRCVDVCDRGADLFEYLDYKHRTEGCYVVRSYHNRSAVVEQDGQVQAVSLHDFARQLPEVGRRQVHVAERPGQPARLAEVAVSFARVRILPPDRPRGQHREEPLEVWVVRAVEIEPPEGVEAVEWILLTNVPVAGWEDACERLDWYEYRWTIEEYHKCQKTGCGIEQPQFTTEAALQPTIALLSVVSVELLRLRQAARAVDAQTRLATDVMPVEFVEVLSAWRYKILRRDLTVHEFYYALARLGGHQNRQRDGAPGWLTLWRGWMKLQLMVEGALALHDASCG